MHITLNIKDMNFNSSAVELEAYRRTLEIREFSRRNGNFASRRVENYTWTTQTGPAQLEVEMVRIDHEAGRISYSHDQVYRLS